MIGEDYLARLELNLEEAGALFDALHYYGKINTLEAAEDMFVSEEPLPLINHWESFEEFMNVCNVFCQISRSLPRCAFTKTIVTGEHIDRSHFSKEQMELIENLKEFKRQACYLLSYFDSMSDYFEYEVEMIERGYPHRHRRIA